MDLRILVIIVCIQYACAMFIPRPSGKRDFRKKATVTSKYSDLLRDLAVIKLKLETMGYGPVYIEGPYRDGPMAKSLQDKKMTAEPTAAVVAEDNGDASSQFNEMEVLELVPVIIEQKRKGNVSPEEENTLKEIFGDLWIVIEEEVNRDESEDMNPILRALLQSRENRLKRALVQPHQLNVDEDGSRLEVRENNDIFGNTVEKVRVTRWPKSFLEVKADELSPQQRLMRHAAFLIRQWFDENSPKAARGGFKRERIAQQARSKKKRGSPRRKANRKKNQNRRRRRRNGRVKKNLRPKRHNTDIYVDDNHAGYDYIEDFEELLDDPMTKPRSMRSSTRPIFNEYDSIEEDERDYDDYE